MHTFNVIKVSSKLALGYSLPFKHVCPLPFNYYFYELELILSFFIIRLSFLYPLSCNKTGQNISLSLYLKIKTTARPERMSMTVLQRNARNPMMTKILYTFYLCMELNYKKQTILLLYLSLMSSLALVISHIFG